MICRPSWKSLGSDLNYCIYMVIYKHIKETLHHTLIFIWFNGQAKVRNMAGGFFDSIHIWGKRICQNIHPQGRETQSDSAESYKHQDQAETQQWQVLADSHPRWYIERGRAVDCETEHPSLWPKYFLFPELYFENPVGVLSLKHTDACVLSDVVKCNKLTSFSFINDYVNWKITAIYGVLTERKGPKTLVNVLYWDFLCVIPHSDKPYCI